MFTETGKAVLFMGTHAQTMLFMGDNNTIISIPVEDTGDIFILPVEDAPAIYRKALNILEKGA